MKILGIEDLALLEYSELIDQADGVIRDWTIERKYFESLNGKPDFERPAYLELVKLTSETFQHLSQLRQNLTPPAQAKITSEHPSQYDEPKKVQLLVEKIEAFMKMYRSLDDYRIRHSSVGRLEEKLLDKVSELEQSVFDEIQKRIEDLTTTVRQDIQTGINDLLNLKSELGLTKEFGGKIESELKAAKNKETLFMKLFIGTLAIIPIVLITIYVLAHSPDASIEAGSIYVLQGSVSVPLLFISLFFFSQYRTYMMIRLRYTHLDGFLGGGATFISQLLEAESPDLKLEVNKKLAEMFMSLDDVLKMVQRSKHPTELTLETAENVFDKISKFRKQG